MKILLDNNNLAFFIGETFTVTDDSVVLNGGAVNSQYNLSNTTVIETDNIPPNPINFAYKWENDAWTVVDQEAIDCYIASMTAAFNAQQKKNRLAAYTVKSDPIFFKSQRGEATNQQWLNAIAAVDSEFPYKV